MADAAALRCLRGTHAPVWLISRNHRRPVVRSTERPAVRVRHGLRHGYPDEKSRTTFKSTSRPTPRTQTRLTGGDHALRQTAGGTSWSAVLAQSPEPISILCAFAHAFSRDDRCRRGIALFDIVNVQNWTVIVQLPPSGREADHRPFVNFCGRAPRQHLHRCACIPPVYP